MTPLPPVECWRPRGRPGGKTSAAQSLGRSRARFLPSEVSGGAGRSKPEIFGSHRGTLPPLSTPLSRELVVCPRRPFCPRCPSCPPCPRCPLRHSPGGDSRGHTRCPYEKAWKYAISKRFRRFRDAGDNGDSVSASEDSGDCPRGVPECPRCQRKCSIYRSFCLARRGQGTGGDSSPCPHVPGSVTWRRGCTCRPCSWPDCQPPCAEGCASQCRGTVPRSARPPARAKDPRRHRRAGRRGSSSS